MNLQDFDSLFCILDTHTRNQENNLKDILCALTCILKLKYPVDLWVSYQLVSNDIDLLVITHKSDNGLYRVIPNMHVPCVALQCSMFQGTFALRVSPEQVTTSIKEHNQRTTSTTLSVLRGLHLESVKYAKKGRLGEVLFFWSSPNELCVPSHVVEQAGSIQLKCKTIPYNYNVSIFVFGNGKVKLCGKMIDPFEVAGIVHEERIDELDFTQEHDLVHDAMQAYLDQVKLYACQVIGAVPDTETFVPGIIHGQFNFGFHIEGVNRLALLAARDMKDLFSYVRGQEPELHARAFAVQMFLKDKKKMHLSFDHKGKVQLFNTKGYHDMRACWDAFISMILRGLEANAITLTEL